MLWIVVAQDCVKLRDWADNIRQHKSVVPTCVSPKPVRIPSIPNLLQALELNRRT